MKTITVLILTAGALLAQGQPDVLLAAPTFEYVSGELVGGSPVKGAPYSAQATTETTQTLADGNRIARSSSAMLYRDSLGRERREQSMAALGPWSAQGEPTQTVFISDPVAGANYDLNVKNRTVRKMPVFAQTQGIKTSIRSTAPMALQGVFESGIATAQVMASGPNVFYKTKIASAGNATPKTEQLGSRTIEGVEAQGTRTTVTIPAGQIGNDRPIDIVSERWFSPELGVTVLSKQSDPRSGETVYKLTQINRSEPLHSLFEVPADYTVAETPGVSLFLNKE
jgi:hypothetical protein